MLQSDSKFEMTGGVWRRRKRVGVSVGRLMLLAGVSALAGWSVFHKSPQQDPVRLVQSQKRDVPIWAQAIGSVQSSKIAQATSQSTGKLLELYATEGQHVQKGEVLARLDTSHYQIQLNQAQADLAQDKAQLKSAERELAKLKKRGKSYKKERQDAFRVTINQFQAAIQSDEAAIEKLQYHIADAQILAPMDGSVGISQIAIGSHLQSGTPIAEITQMQPARVTFSLADLQISQIRKNMVATNQPVRVEALDVATGKLLATGALNMTDNRTDPAHGRMTLQAHFDNQDQALWRGASVRVRMLIDTVKDATVIPASAVVRAEDKHYVYVADTLNGTVTMRDVSLATITDEEAVIKNGIMPGEKVIVQPVSSRLAELSPKTAEEYGAISTSR